ncbi:protein disabled [Lepeophtheirus salmonis]|uniref:protein disabled n=1 Tax=Lepeophtheirus salmonis TaxID=72036 RepID=UPI001AE42882|nr:protein disabled-like [Lepeophtheirus salmonis]
MNNKKSDLMITGSGSQLDLNALYNVNKPLSQWQGPFDAPLQGQQNMSGGFNTAPARPNTLAGLSSQPPSQAIPMMRNTSFPSPQQQQQIPSPHMGQQNFWGLSTSAPMDQGQHFAITPDMLNNFIKDYGSRALNPSFSSPQMAIPEEPVNQATPTEQQSLDLSFFHEKDLNVSFNIGDHSKEEEKADKQSPETVQKEAESMCTSKSEENKVEKKQRTYIPRWFKRSVDTPPQTPENEDAKPMGDEQPPKPLRLNTPSQPDIKGRMGNEQKFMGEGQTFKGKLIGVLEVQNARGDRMCQDALQELKIAVKASGEHKQRIIIHIAVDGLKIRDEKNGDCLYHHPVHKISFIAQDMADSRAFGYIYGSPENGHRFFGIKTEKAAAQVVVAMRDLFQVVFDMKQQEIEQTKKQLDSNPINNKREDTKKPDVISGTTPSNNLPDTSSHPLDPGMNHSNVGALSDLLGLQDELTHIQAGIRQIDKIAPTAPMSFQTDSMIPLGVRNNPIPAQQLSFETHVTLNKRPAAIMNMNPVTTISGSDAFGAAPFLPPPPSKSGGRTSRPITVTGHEPIYGTHPQNTPPMHSASPMLHVNNNNAPMVQTSKTPTNMNIINNTLNNFKPSDKYKPFESFDETNKIAGFHSHTQDPNDLTSKSVHGNINNQLMGMGMLNNKLFDNSGTIPQFTDLDPLGTSKSKPYMDTKDFFNEPKTPPSRINERTSSPGSDVLSSSIGSFSGMGAFGPNIGEHVPPKNMVGSAASAQMPFNQETPANYNNPFFGQH